MHLQDPEAGVVVVMHGDDVIVQGTEAQRRWFREKLGKRLKLSCSESDWSVSTETEPSEASATRRCPVAPAATRRARSATIRGGFAMGALPWASW